MKRCTATAFWVMGAMGAACAMLLAPSVQAGEQAKFAAVTWVFEDAQAGRLPAGWQADKTGEGPGSVWKVVEDATAPAGPHVLAQTSSEGPRPLFNLCVLQNPVLADVALCVSLKAVGGRIDQGGGLVWRYQDRNNYYICRVNPLEANFRLYKVIGGKRIQLASAPASSERRWTTVRVEHRGTHIRCWLDGQLLLESQDDAIGRPGQVGLWTKADAVTHFDNLRIEATE